MGGERGKEWEEKEEKKRGGGEREREKGKGSRERGREREEERTVNSPLFNPRQTVLSLYYSPYNVHGII